jgi:hypothetical protein
MREVQLKPCANGCTKRMAWRSSTKRSIRRCVCASRPSSKWPGAVIHKNSEAIPAFQATCQTQLQQVVPPANTCPVRVFSQDESRFGLLTIRRRRLTARGMQPVGPVQHVFEWFYVYSAVEPTTGERFFLELPYLNAAMFQLFVDSFAHAFPHSLNIRLLDNSGARTAARLTLPQNVRLLFLPPLLPGVEPDRAGLARCEGRSDLAAVHRSRCPTGSPEHPPYEADALQSLTGYPYLGKAIYALRVERSDIRPSCLAWR